LSFTAVYDADVLYPAPLRDLLLTLGGEGEFRARYSAEILDEVFRNLKGDRPDLSPEALDRTRLRMEEAIPDVLVVGHMTLVESLVLPDPGDRHVLAAAIKAGAEVIVTRNQVDFPASALAEFDVEAQDPDVFVHHLVDLVPGMVCGAINRMSRRLQNPPRSPAEVVDTLERNGLVQTAASLRPIL